MKRILPYLCVLIVGGCTQAPLNVQVHDNLLTVEAIIEVYPELEGIVISAPEWTDFEARRYEETGKEFEDEYLLVPSIQLNIEILNEKDMTRQIFVGPDGKFDFPLIGRVKAAGKTIPELKEHIRELLLPYIKDPQILLNPTGFSLLGGADQVSGGDILIMGETGSAGFGDTIDYTGDETIMQVIAATGGFSDRAEQRQVRIFRKDAELGWKIILVNFHHLLKFADMRQNVRLRPGDLVFVPEKFTPGEHFKHDWELILGYVSGISEYMGFRREFRKDFQKKTD